MNTRPSHTPGSATAYAASADEPRAPEGVTGAWILVRAGGVTVTRSLPAPAFALEPGETLDPRLPPGPFSASLLVVFDPGASREAYIGAQFRGGSVVIRRGDALLHSGDVAGAEPRLVMSNLPHALRRSGERIVYDFETNGDGPVALRALWRPIDSVVAIPIPPGGNPLMADEIVRGRAIVERLGCVACHAISPAPSSHERATLAYLASHPAPRLDRPGARRRPQWLRAWIRDPHAIEPATPMPSLAHGDRLGDDDVEDLVHFIIERAGLAEPDAAEPDDALVHTGRELYMEVGCFACHGPLEPAPGEERVPRLWRLRAPLPPLRARTTTATLAAFLFDPLDSRPDGSMPGLMLSAIEAKAIASYLCAREGAAPPDDRPFEIDHVRAERGRLLFAETGCANCHAFETDPVEPAIVAAPLDQLAGASDRGCLADEPPTGSPDFALDDLDRADLAALLAILPERASDAVPIDALIVSFDRLGCAACHDFHANPGPEAAIARSFSTLGEADLGDEGRLPPRLTDAGSRLTTPWMRAVLAEGERARPYLAARMPDFGRANVDHLPEWFAAAAGATPLLDAAPDFSTERARVGRELVGSNGLDCIQCHVIAGRDATGTPGPDLALMPGRLRYESFARWIHDPLRLAPGTRMPSFFVGGIGARTDLLDGDASEQIGAMWSYLSPGETLSLPEGLEDPAGFELVVGERPVVFRTFMADAGVRAIACGYPEGVHCAFDADRVRLAAAWDGHFLSAQGAWGARGGSETNPAAIGWKAPEEDAIDIAPASGAPSVPSSPDSPSSSNSPSMRRFRGYSLDGAGRPTFEYEIERDGIVIDVRETPDPKAGAASIGRALVRRFTLAGPAGTRIVVRDGVDPRVLRLDDAGRATFDLEVRW